MASIGDFFLDSGAHSLYTEQVLRKNKQGTKDKTVFRYYDTVHFKNYVDRYAEYLKANPEIKYYVNVDVIFDPDRSWKILKYLERKHGLNPVPVIHYGTDLKWIERHLAEGYDLLGIGGLGQEATRVKYLSWADRVFDLLCPHSNDRFPIVRTHGFAMTSFQLMKRYPWWSVDSTSWVKMAGYGSIYVPHKRNDVFDFSISPWRISISKGNKKSEDKNREKIRASISLIERIPDGFNPKKLLMRHLKDAERKTVVEWINQAGVTLEEAETVHEKRCLVNLAYFNGLIADIPPYPTRFSVQMKRRLI